MDNIIKELENKDPELTKLLDEATQCYDRYFEILNILEDKYPVDGYYWNSEPNSGFAVCLLKNNL